jgi:hypothetical protein
MNHITKGPLYEVSKKFTHFILQLWRIQDSSVYFFKHTPDSETKFSDTWIFIDPHCIQLKQNQNNLKYTVNAAHLAHITIPNSEDVKDTYNGYVYIHWKQSTEDHKLLFPMV